MTQIGSNAITYDEIGNMLTFGARTFTWEHGRQLASQTVNGSTWTYTYNTEGMRTGRTNGTNSYEYIYNGSQLMQMTRNGVVVNFTYINGIPATISFDGMTFYYVVNGQGDITGIVDSTGKVQLRYYYDAWGVSTSVYSDDAVYGLSLATINPLRYRGYVFDWEVGLYYLQSRYYIPEIGRFLNADSYSSTGQGVLGNNMFAYCGNSPVGRIDASGDFWNVIAGAIIGGAINLVTSVASEIVEGNFELKDLGQIAVSTAIGVAEGALVAAVPGAAAAISAVASASETVINGVIDQKSPQEIFVEATVSGAIGAIGGSSGSDFVKGNKLMNNAVGSIGKVAQKGVHPTVKKAAKKTVKKATKYVEKAYISGQVESFAYAGISTFTSYYANEEIKRYR